eukprot:Tbor_TRINITY_DN4987_c8_g4::TRINITY_DN4987_c8_g4_i1::g.9819::m.9819
MSNYYRQQPSSGRGARGRGVARGGPPQGSRYDGYNGVNNSHPSMLIREIDTSDLLVEEDLQREKLKSAVEVKEGLLDVQECFNEFQKLQQDQAPQLTMMENNVSSALTATQKGNENLKAASKEQKTSRKCICILVGILSAVLLVVVIVVVVIVKK